jgi:hypothetical protein
VLVPCSLSVETLLVELSEALDNIKAQSINKLVNVNVVSEDILETDGTLERARVEVDTNTDVKTIAAVLLECHQHSRYLLAINKDIIDPLDFYSLL